jgi:prohibitin 1
MKARLNLIATRLKVGSIFFMLVSLFVLAVCWERIVITIPPGHGGVLWHLLFGGTRTAENGMGEGVHVILPWNRIYVYNLRLQSHHTSYNVVTSDGLQIKIGVSFRWRANPAQIGTLHQKFGPKYRDTLIAPAIGSITRHIVSRYSVEDLVSRRRNMIQQEIFTNVVSRHILNGIGPVTVNDISNAVLLEDILITDVDLPKNVRQAIEAKLSQAQLVEEYRYRVEREELESQRKAVEAEGIRKFQQIVASNMSNSYLRWRGIEATLELARSPNSKIVVIGNQQSGGLPLILDGADKNAGPSPSPARAPSTTSPVTRPAPLSRP